MMNLNRLAIRYLKQQKKRSWLTVLGIVLSMALIFSATTMGEALKDNMLESIKLDHGDYHAAYLDLTADQVSRLKDNAKVLRTAVKRDAGKHIVRTGLTISITGGDEEFLNVMSLKLDEGRLPSADGEIALEKWVADNMPGRPKIGDKLRISVTETVPEQADGAGPAVQASTRELEFTVTGLFRNKAATQQFGSGFGIVTLAYADTIRAGFQAAVNEWDAAVVFKKGVKLQNAIRETGLAIGAAPEQIAPNQALLTALGEGSNSSQNRSVLIAQAIVIAIIMTATVAVIYNAFHISVLERIRQFGILRSVGMTPRQIRQLVLREALLLAGAGIPAGVLTGWGVVEALMAIFGWMDDGRYFGSLKVVIHWYVPTATVLVGLVTVLLSALGPAFAAGRVTPLEALFHQNRFNKSKAFRRNRFGLRLPLGITARMARDNLKRNRKRYRITLFSLSLGIMLFIFFTSFLMTLQEADQEHFTKDLAVDVMNLERPGLTVGDYDEATSIPGVKRVYRTMQQFGHVEVPPDKFTASYKMASGGNPLVISDHLYGYPPSELEMLRSDLVQGTVDPDKMNEENGVLVIQNVWMNRKPYQATDLKVGDSIVSGALDESTGQWKTHVNLKVAGILRDSSLSNQDITMYTVITTQEVFAKLTGKSDVARFDVELEEGADAKAVKESLRRITDRNPEARILDFTEDQNKIVMLQLSILLYGLVTVISVISAINIMNTISTNLILRTKEFGTLRAVGMTMKQMRRMIVFESAWYGIMATLYGGTAGTLLAYAFYWNVKNVQRVPYHFPWIEVLAAGAVSALLCLLASRIPLRRIERMDIVEAVRAEE